MPIIPTELIPNVLWRPLSRPSARRGTHVLRLPTLLVDSYRALIDEYGLREEAEDSSPQDEGPQGGMSLEETLTHFARNFSGSCARIQLVMLDPKDVFQTTRDLFATLFAGGALHLLDIPCGAGAASATLLCLTAELRRAGILPKVPLDVTVVGGDISGPARRIKRELYRKLRPNLLDQAISVKIDVRDWNVRSADDTSDLIERWIRGQTKKTRSAIVALNFSGFLSQRIQQHRAQLQEFLRYGYTRRSAILWVEPCTNDAIDHLFPALQRHVLVAVPRIAPAWADWPRRTECAVAHPIRARGVFTARAAAIQLDPGAVA